MRPGQSIIYADEARYPDKETLILKSWSVNTHSGRSFAINDITTFDHHSNYICNLDKEKDRQWNLEQWQVDK